MIFLNPLLGMAAGATAGAIGDALTDVGINSDFMKEVAIGFKNGTSALFMLVMEVTPDKVLAELEGTGGKVLQTSLTHDQEEKLQAALSAPRPEGGNLPTKSPKLFNAMPRRGRKRHVRKVGLPAGRCQVPRRLRTSQMGLGS